MDKLIKTLRKETQTLETQYIALMKEWATDEFERISTITEQQIRDEHGYESHWQGRKHMSHTKKSDRIWTNICNIKYKGLDIFITKAELNAKLKYDHSI